ncbi:hypothetical protein TWF106_005786 [Orbilia oligospora]|uniref:Uncharacterized protein n=1 Tax=Orbilia oligospora TaxID=2813651 RepID=A0A6G1M162_ORBOL|nr:hypothetical protein TWF788_011548 [Orbilia oligospora]KAF3195043.1 hypothetical protein TWF106_005786 [Orbilia oligospora]KAF3215167.1 hypothetical protein TWF679_004412 [Orbilia oligospora]KAF3240564.1 hypothetical protein TWF192_009461 [Orbilia oligospora]
MALPSPSSSCNCSDSPRSYGRDDNTDIEDTVPRTYTKKQIKPANLCRHRGAEVLGNHLIIEHIVRHLPDVVDIINLRRTCPSVSEDVKHYLIRQAESLDFSNTPSAPDHRIREFLRVFSSPNRPDQIILFEEPLHQWDRLTYLDLSNTGVTADLMINIILQTFQGVDWGEYNRSKDLIGTDRFPECFVHLNYIRAQGCASLDIEQILELLQRLLFKKLRKYWDQDDAPAAIVLPFLAPQAGPTVKSPIGSQAWRGPVPTNVEDLEKAGLIGYTRLEKLFLGNSGKLSIEREFWQKTPGNCHAETCPFQHNVARWLCITGALGIETELMFCHSYCDSRNAFLWDGWTLDKVPDNLIDDYSQMRLHHTVHQQLVSQGTHQFPKLVSEDPMPRMPWEARIEHPPSGRNFYFPGTGADHEQQLQIDDMNLSTSLVCTSAIDQAVTNFSSYNLSEQRYSLHRMTKRNWAFQENWTHPNPRPATPDEGWLAYLFRYCLRERNFQLYKYAMPNSPRDNLEILPPYPAVNGLTIEVSEVEYVLKRMLRCPLPRRIFPPNVGPPILPEFNWWDLRGVALIEYPRGLCSHCLREVWLCESCNRNPKAFCAECMISMQENTNAKGQMSKPDKEEEKKVDLSVQDEDEAENEDGI